jgi:hypothetical protein
MERQSNLPSFSRPAVRLLPGLVLVLFFGCSTPPRTTLAVADSSTASRVEAIQMEAKRMQAAIGAAGSTEFRQVEKDLPHWQFSGSFKNSKPVYLRALFSQGGLVRAETYYILNGNRLLVEVETWWDVDNPRDAPEPKTAQEFYLENDRTIRHVVQIASSPPASHTDDTARPAAGLEDRSRLIAQILMGAAQESTASRSLEPFPEAEASKQ